MIKITLPDGSIREFASGVTPMEVAKNISEGFARNVISASFNGTTIETETPLTTDGNLILYTWNDAEGKKAFWHSTSHVMAQALEELYPGIKLTLGPAIANGFYYDVDFEDQKISEADFKKIEDRILEIARGKFDFKMRPVTKAEALEMYKDNVYKTELISNLEDGTITFCDHATFTDLCRGGHIPNTGIIKAVKIMSVAGAYWRGDEKNKQLTRVYGTSFPKQKDLTEYLELLEEAKSIVTEKKNTHRDAYERMRAYWHASIQMGLTDEHDYVGKEVSMEDAIQDIEGDGDTAEDLVNYAGDEIDVKALRELLDPDLPEDITLQALITTALENWHANEIRDIIDELNLTNG